MTRLQEQNVVARARSLTRTQARNHVKSALSHAAVPGAVQAFAAECRIADSLRDAMSLAGRVFRSIRKLETRIQIDPEVDAKRIIIDVCVNGDTAAVLASKKKYTDEWVRIASPEARAKINLQYHLV
jgi:hypothetical protein